MSSRLKKKVSVRLKNQRVGVQGAVLLLVENKKGMCGVV